MDWFPVSCLSGPSVWSPLFSFLVNPVPFGQKLSLATVMTIVGGYKTGGAVQMLIVIPINETINPSLGFFNCTKELRRIFGSEHQEQVLVGIFVNTKEVLTMLFSLT